MLNRKLRMGMIGGGPGSFIGAIHRKAANLDGAIELVCGVFSSDEEKSRQTGKSLFLPPDRIYGTYKEMFRREAALPAEERIDFVSIVTPNHVHFEPAKLALEQGFHVVLDKPVTLTLKEAKDLATIVKKTGSLFCVTHTYTGYPMVKEAREQVTSGKFGKITKVLVEYPQGWLSKPVEKNGNKQAAWRTDPGKAGKAGAIGDIGTHAFNLAEYVSGLEVTRICASIQSTVPDRPLDDDGTVLLHFNNGCSGVVVATQVAAGEENNIKIRVYGEKGGVEWQQENANALLIKWSDRPTELWTAGNEYLSALAKFNCRTPPGHPEGYIEAFANHYRNFAYCILAKLTGQASETEWLDFPGIEAGVRGMQFIETVLESSKKQGWVDFV